MLAYHLLHLGGNLTSLASPRRLRTDYIICYLWVVILLLSLLHGGCGQRVAMGVANADLLIVGIWTCCLLRTTQATTRINQGSNSAIGFGNINGQNVWKYNNIYIIGDTSYAIPEDHKPLLAAEVEQSRKEDLQDKVCDRQEEKVDRLEDRIENLEDRMEDGYVPNGERLLSQLKIEFGIEQRKLKEEKVKLRGESNKLDRIISEIFAKITNDFTNGKLSATGKVSNFLPSLGIQGAFILGNGGGITVGTGQVGNTMFSGTNVGGGSSLFATMNHYGTLSSGVQVARRGNQYSIGNAIYDVPAEHKPLIDAVEVHSNKMTEIGNEQTRIGNEMSAIGNKMSNAGGAQMASLQGQMRDAQRRMAVEGSKMNAEGAEMRKKAKLLLDKIEIDLKNGKLKAQSQNTQVPLSNPVSFIQNANNENMNSGNINNAGNSFQGNGNFGNMFQSNGRVGCHNQNNNNGFSVITYGNRPNGEAVVKSGDKYMIGNKLYDIPDDHKPLINSANAQFDKVHEFGDLIRSIGAEMREIGSRMGAAYRSGNGESVQSEMREAERRMKLEGAKQSQATNKMIDECTKILHKIEEDLTTGKLKASNAGGQTTQAVAVSQPVVSVGAPVKGDTDDQDVSGSGDDDNDSGPTIQYGQLYNREQLSRQGNKYTICDKTYKIPSAHKPLIDAVQEGSAKVEELANRINTLQQQVNGIREKLRSAKWWTKWSLQNELNTATESLNAEKKKKDSATKKMNEDSRKLIQQVNNDLKSGNLKPVQKYSTAPVTSSDLHQSVNFDDSIEFAQNPVFQTSSDGAYRPLTSTGSSNVNDNPALASVLPEVYSGFMKIDLGTKMYTIDGKNYQIPANHLQSINSMLERSKEVKRIAAKYKVVGPASSREEIRALGDMIRSRGDDKRREGDRIRSEGDRIRNRGSSMRSWDRAGGDRMRQEGDRRRAEGDRVREEGDRIRAEGDWVRSQADYMRSDQDSLASNIAADLRSGGLKPITKK